MRLNVSLFVLFFMMAIHTDGQTKIGELYYEFSGDEAWVCKPQNAGEDGWYTNEKCIIPESVVYQNSSFRVTRIENLAFRKCTKIRSVLIPNTVTYIGERAFAYCNLIQSIVIPSSVKEFGDFGGSYSPFYKCDLLRTIIYAGEEPPKKWVATSNTFVTDIESYTSPSFKIGDPTITEMIKFSNNNCTYSGKSPIITWVNNIDGYTVTLTMPSLKIDVGNYKEVVPTSFTKDGESFTANVVLRYSINTAHLTAKAENASREYGENNPVFEISYSGFVNGENESSFSVKPSAKTTATKSSSVGEYPITISKGKSNNYEVEYEPGVLTVNKAPLSAAVRDTSKIYGSYNPSFKLNFSGLKNSESQPVWMTAPTFETDATKYSKAGKYVVKAVNGDAKNYDVTFLEGLLTINKAQLKIVAENKSRLYFEKDSDFTCQYSGFVNNESASVLKSLPQITTTATINSKAGKYPINVFGADADNYDITYISGILEITKRTLNASTGKYTRAFNEDNPTFEIKYDGFVNGEDQGVLISEPTASTSATKNSNTGSYPIVVSGGVADNYEFKYKYGRLVIEKAYQNLLWNQDLSNIMQYDQIELGAFSSSDLPIKYTLSNDTVASVNYIGTKAYLDCFHYGKVVLSAQQEGNVNYWPTTKIYKEVNVSIATGIGSVTNVNKEYGDISFKNGRIVAKGLKKGAVLKITNLSGVTIYSGGDCDLKVPKGVYIVRLGIKEFKIVVK